MPAWRVTKQLLTSFTWTTDFEEKYSSLTAAEKDSCTRNATVVMVRSPVACWIIANVQGHTLNLCLQHDIWSVQQSSHTFPQNILELTEPPEQSAGTNCHDISITAKRHSPQTTFWSKTVTSHAHILVKLQESSLFRNTWGVQILRYPNFFLGNASR